MERILSCAIALALLASVSGCGQCKLFRQPTPTVLPPSVTNSKEEMPRGKAALPRVVAPALSGQASNVSNHAAPVLRDDSGPVLLPGNL